MKSVSFVIIVALMVSLQACGDERPGPNIRDLTEQESQLVAASNGFGFELFREVVDQTADSNVFISPLSVSLALGMTYNGARENTEAGMRDALAFGDLSVEEINEGFRGLTEYLTNLDPDVKMEIANSIWYREGFDVLQSFIDVNVTYFDAAVSALDFSDAGAADVMNAWVEEKTHGLIDKIVKPPIDPLTMMFLINAVYFKGTWTNQFKKSQTHDGVFHTAAGSENTVKLMQQTATVPYLSNADFQAVNLPYGYELFSMTILLPREGQDIDELVAELNDANWTAWLAGFSEQEIVLEIPRFELAFEKKLNDVLIALGMTDAFNPDLADFTGIREIGELYISNVRHKTFVKVNEEGTEAAAVTSVEVGTLSMPETMTVDRPFVVVIHDSHSRAMIFMGKVIDLPAE